MRRLLFAIIALAGLLIVAPSVAQPAEPGPEELRTLAKLRGIRRSSRGCRPGPRARSDRETGRRDVASGPRGGDRARVHYCNGATPSPLPPHLDSGRSTRTRTPNARRSVPA
jgi:hypothetical protein